MSAPPDSQTAQNTGKAQGTRNAQGNGADPRTGGLTALRQEILDLALPNVPFDGWTTELLENAGKAAGVTPGRLEMAFPDGLLGLMDFYSLTQDDALTARLEAVDMTGLKIREKVTLGVRTRIELMSDHKDAARRAAALLALPQNAPRALACLYRTTDRIWRGIGDPSTDFNFYTKRLTLSGVYSSTLLFWFEDFSEGAAESWTFLDRRIENVMQFEKAKAAVTGQLSAMPDLAGILGRLRYPGPSRRH